MTTHVFDTINTGSEVIYTCSTCGRSFSMASPGTTDDDKAPLSDDGKFIVPSDDRIAGRLGSANCTP